MSFSQAFKYPFRNFAKVFSIVLVLTIAFAAFIALIMNSYDWVELWNSLTADDIVEYATHDLESFTPAVFIGVLGVLVVAIVAGFWLSGYSVAVIRSLIDGVEVMPDISFSRNLKDGAYLFVDEPGVLVPLRYRDYRRGNCSWNRRIAAVPGRLGRDCRGCHYDCDRLLDGVGIFRRYGAFCC